MAAPRLAATVHRNDRRASRTIVLGGTVGVACMGVFFLLLLLSQFGAARLLVSIVLAMLAVPLYVYLALKIDRYEPEPRKLLAWAFFWGACGATFIAFIVNTVGGAIVGSSFGSDVGEIYASNISAPIVEESAKAVALFAIYRWFRREFNGVLDGIIYACMVGLGFAMAENILYYAKEPTSFFGRGVLSPYAHPLFTSMTGIGLGLASLTSDPTKKFRAIVLGLAGAMVAHGIWNGVFSTGGHFLVWYVVAAVPAFIAFLSIIWILNRRESGIISKYLQPDVESGLFSKQEVDRLASVRERRRARRAAKARGKDALRAEKAFQQTASELAFHRRARELGSSSSASQEDERAYIEAIKALRKAAQQAAPVAPAKQASPRAAGASPTPAQLAGTSAFPSGWYADPWSPGRLRFWDGHAYTWHTAPMARPSS